MDHFISTNMLIFLNYQSRGHSFDILNLDGFLDLYMLFIYISVFDYKNTFL